MTEGAPEAEREREVRAEQTKRPDLSTEDGRLAFIKVLNDRLPRKRAIAQGLWRNAAGEVLLCELTYKKALDLPGGVVDPFESPATCVAREVHEELGVEAPVGALLAVNWLPPYRGWDDATLFLFDLGIAPAGIEGRMRFMPREIKAVHWLAPDALAEHVAPYTDEMIRYVLASGVIESGHTAYLENSAPRA